MLDKLCDKIEQSLFLEASGKVESVRQDTLNLYIPNAKVGSVCRVKSSSGDVRVEIVSLHPDGHVAMPLDSSLVNVQLGDVVEMEERSASIQVSEGMLGHVVDSLGVSYDDADILFEDAQRVPLYSGDINPMKRELITEPLDLGIRSINACLTCGKGQRQGIFAGSGVGKSVLLGMIATYTAADVVVIALIGERGREVREFIERELGEEGRKKSVIVVETADRPAVRRVRGAYSAMAVAEFFRSKGNNVLVLMDSLTRFAMAQREVGIAAGEPPTTKGYTPSVFTHIGRLAERAGNWGEKGSITGLYTVLVEGDDLEDPVADSCRAILDGHVVLSRRLANRGQYPAIDILESVSRVMDQVVSEQQLDRARYLKELLARYRENEDAITYGMYPRGTNALIDEAIEKFPFIQEFLRQRRGEHFSMNETQEALQTLFEPVPRIEGQAAA